MKKGARTNTASSTYFGTSRPPRVLSPWQIETDVLPYAERHRLTVFAYGALWRGLLTGKITDDT